MVLAVGRRPFAMRIFCRFVDENVINEGRNVE